MYVYRDSGGQPGDSADPAALAALAAPAASPAAGPAEHDAAYWYDLVMKDDVPKREESRGPFEPLVSSSGPPPGGERRPSASPDAATAAEQAGTEQRRASPDAVRDEGPDDTARAQARKLEQIKDLYLTAEAIGEQNVDKHFDQLLAQQRQLISEYFRQSAAARPAEARPAEARPAAARPAEARPAAARPAEARPAEAGPAEAGPAEARPAVAGPRDGLGAEAGPSQHDPRDRRVSEQPGASGGRAATPEGAGVAAEHPRAW